MAGGLFGGRRRERRRRLEVGFDDAWREVCADRFDWWDLLAGDERERVERLTLGFVVDWSWEAANHFELTDDMPVTVAAQVALMNLGLADHAFGKVGAVVLHPTTVVLGGEHSQVDGIVSDGPMEILGEADEGGPVVLAWDEVLADLDHPGDGRNVVFHEFAHVLDHADGVSDGTPVLADPADVGPWVEVCTRVYEAVVEGRSEVLDPYAGVNPAEFFAVVTETFFDDPIGLAAEHPDLYGVLRGHYRQDPARRLGGNGTSDV